MKKFIIFGLSFLSLILLLPMNVYARSGCCSHHGGVAGCNSDGRQICNDGMLSPTCTCDTSNDTYGYIDLNVENYDYEVEKDDESSKHYAINYSTDNYIDSVETKNDVDDASFLSILIIGGIIFMIFKFN